MIKFLVTAVIVLICVFLMALMLCLMIWVITRLLRFLFPGRFRPVPSVPKKKKINKVIAPKSKKPRPVDPEELEEDEDD